MKTMRILLGQNSEDKEAGNGHNEAGNGYIEAELTEPLQENGHHFCLQISF